MKALDLTGSWKAGPSSEASKSEFCDPDFDDGTWPEVLVPMQEKSSESRDFEGDSTLLRHRFTLESPENARSWLTFAGVANDGNVWFDGGYCGDLEGYFAPHTFEVTNALAVRTDHVIAVDVISRATSEASGSDSREGIWAPVRIVHTGAIRIARLKVICSDANQDRAVLTVRAELDSLQRRNITVRTTVTGVKGVRHPGGQHVTTHVISGGANRLRWTVELEKPELWWPWELGSQPLFDVTVDVIDSEAPDEPSDTASVRMGLRRVAYEHGIFFVNGERFFLKGVRTATSTIPEQRDAPSHIAELKAAGANLIVADKSVEPNSFYESADATGMLVFQSLPGRFVGDSSRTSPRLARQAAETLGHHPSIALWLEPSRKTLRPPRLDSVAKAIEKADSSRPAISIGLRKHVPAVVKAAQSQLQQRLRKPRFVYIAEPEVDGVELDSARAVKYKDTSGVIVGNHEGLSDGFEPVRLFVQGSPHDRIRGARTVTLVNDLRESLSGIVHVRLATSAGDLEWTWQGEVQADSASVVGSVDLTGRLGPGHAQLELTFENDSMKVTRTQSL